MASIVVGYQVVGVQRVPTTSCWCPERPPLQASPKVENRKKDPEEIRYRDVEGWRVQGFLKRGLRGRYSGL